MTDERDLEPGVYVRQDRSSTAVCAAAGFDGCRGPATIELRVVPCFETGLWFDLCPSHARELARQLVEIFEISSRDPGTEHAQCVAVVGSNKLLHSFPGYDGLESGHSACKRHRWIPVDDVRFMPRADLVVLRRRLCKWCFPKLSARGKRSRGARVT